MGNQVLMTMALAAAAILPAAAQPTPPAPPPARGTMHMMMAGGPRLGVGVMDVDADRAKALKLSEVRGAEVTTVGEGSPAAKAGIKVGDVIWEYNGTPIHGTEELIHLVSSTPSGKQVKIVLMRNGSPVTVTAAPETATFPGMDGNNWPFGGNMPPFPAMPNIDIPRMVTTYQSSTLGVECETLGPNSQLAEFFGVKDGLLVRSVSHNSAAEKAGVKAGDIIVKLGETHIANQRDFAAALRASRASANVPVTIVRNKKEMSMTMALQDARREHF